MTNWNQNGWIKGRLTLDADCNDNEWNEETNSWDEGLEGKIVKLLDLHGNVVATSITNHAGEYVFDVPAGHYRVMFPKPDGYMFSAKDSGVDDHYDSDADQNGMTDVIGVWAGETVRNIDAGLKPKPQDPDCIIIEAEDMHKNGFKTVSGDQAMGGKLVKLKDAQGSGDLSTHFNGDDGHYDLTVFVQDESDGQSKIKVKVNGHVVDTIHLDRDSDGRGSNNGGFSEFTLEGVEINKGDKIVLWADGDDHGYEFVRIDKIVLKPGEKPNSPPDAKDDCIVVCEDEAGNDVDGNVLTNDTDPDGDPLSVSGVAGDAGNVGQWVDLDKGRVKIEADGTIDFDADGDFDDLKAGEVEEVTVMYDISDGNGGQDWAKVTIKVEGKEPPIVDELCTFRLLNHPDGGIREPGYGLRLDGLLGDGQYTFDFEAEGSEMFVTVDPDAGTIRIFGTAVGGKDIGSAYEDPKLYKIDFTYDMVEQADGDDDLVVDASNAMNGSGTIMQLDDQGNPVQSWDLTDKAGNNPFSFRFGDEDDDTGHRGFDGKSGWGWLLVDGEDKPGAQDWLFTVGEKVVIDAEDDCIIVTESEGAGDIEVLEGGATSILDNDTVGDNQPYTGAVFEVDGQEANVGEFIDLAGGGRIKINADGTVDFDADGDFEDLDDGEMAMVSVEYTIRLPGSTQTVERVIDFEGLQRGTIVNTQIDGVMISAQRAGDGDNSPNDAMIFDSSNPTGGDDDLGTPNQGNILIISEDGDSNDPDDNAGGGTFWLKFDEPEHVGSITFIDTEEGGATIFVIFADGTNTTLTGPQTVDGGIGVFDIGLDNVVQLDIHLEGSGAIDDIVLKDTIETPPQEDTATVKIKILGETDTGSISGRYFCDDDFDGVDDGDVGGDFGVGGALVMLLEADGVTPVLGENGAPITTTTNIETGEYRFDDIPEGEYVVKFAAPPAGKQFIPPNVGNDDSVDSDVEDFANGTTGVIRVVADQETKDVDAGVAAVLGSISGRYFNDENRDDIENGGDTGVGGATVQLFAQGGAAPIATTTTNADGTYTFTDIVPGDYFVRFISEGDDFEFVLEADSASAGADDTNDSDVATVGGAGNGNTEVFSLAPGEDKEDVDAGIQLKQGSISGRYFNDENRDDIENGGDTGVGGATVQLFAQGGTTPVATTTTNPDGTYTFTDVDSGDYFVRFISEGNDFDFVLEADSASAGADDTNDSDVASVGGAGNGNTEVFSLAPGEDKDDVDAGIQVKLGSISGRYFRDNNRNDFDDGDLGGDFGIGGQIIMLFLADGITTATDENGIPLTATTDAETGNYRFDNLLPGDYVVKFPQPPAGTAFVTPNVGDEADDSDVVDLAGGKTDPVTVLPDTETADVDGGVKASVGSIRGRFFNDENRDNIENAGDTGFDDAMVLLFAAGGTTPVDTTLTNGDGEYEFQDVAPGDYFVRFVSTSSDFDFVLEADSDAAGADDTNDSDVTSVATGDGDTDVFSLAAGEELSDVDGGAQIGLGSISGRYFRDANGNNVDDGDVAGDFGIGMQTVMLLLEDGVTPATDVNGNMLTTTTNPETGEYRFDDLLPGNYVVKFQLPPADSAFVTPNIGDEADDSDVVNFATGTTAPVVVAAKTETLNVDAGQARQSVDLSGTISTTNQVVFIVDWSSQMFSTDANFFQSADGDVNGDGFSGGMIDAVLQQVIDRALAVEDGVQVYADDQNFHIILSGYNEAAEPDPAPLNLELTLSRTEIADGVANGTVSDLFSGQFSSAPPLNSELDLASSLETATTFFTGLGGSGADVDELIILTDQDGFQVDIPTDGGGPAFIGDVTTDGTSAPSPSIPANIQAQIDLLRDPNGLDAKTDVVFIDTGLNDIDLRLLEAIDDDTLDVVATAVLEANPTSLNLGDLLIDPADMITDFAVIVNDGMGNLTTVAGLSPDDLEFRTTDGSFIFAPTEISAAVGSIIDVEFGIDTDGDSNTDTTFRWSDFDFFGQDRTVDPGDDTLVFDINTLFAAA